MGKKGGNRKLKRLAAPKSMPILRKVNEWIVKPIPGRHPVDKSVALAVLLRDILKIAGTLKEVKKILLEKEVLIDGKFAKKYNLAIGFMDVVSIPKQKKNYLVLFDAKGRITLREADSKEGGRKICKIIAKRTVPKAKIQLSLHDGRTIIADNSFRVGDSIELAIPKQSIIKRLELKKGAKCIILGGNHMGDEAVLEEIIPGTATRKPEARMNSGNEGFITRLKYLFVIG